MSHIKQKAVRRTHLRCLYCLLVLLVFFLVEIDGQFFTKSSKSIPRMGRRSVADTSLIKRMSQYRRSLIDALVDEYGPNLISKLEQAKENDVGHGGEYSYDNYQPPFEVSPRDDSGQLSRDERSPASGQLQRGYQEASLAMRALDANRYIRHLASGLSPASFESLLENLKERPQTNGSRENM